jgi:hypothetical protein
MSLFEFDMVVRSLWVLAMTFWSVVNHWLFYSIHPRRDVTLGGKPHCPRKLLITHSGECALAKQVNIGGFPGRRVRPDVRLVAQSLKLDQH